MDLMGSHSAVGGAGEGKNSPVLHPIGGRGGPLVRVLDSPGEGQDEAAIRQVDVTTDCTVAEPDGDSAPAYCTTDAPEQSNSPREASAKVSCIR